MRINHYCRERHRLLVGCKNKAPELWDTQSGQRVAVLADHEGLLEACDWSPDKSRFATGTEVGFYNSITGREKIVRPVCVWDTATGRLVRKIPIDLSGRDVRDSTDWQLRWLDGQTILLELHARWNPARASVWTIFARLDLDKGMVTRLTGPREIGESLTLSPDGKRAVATREYSFLKNAGGGVGRGGRGTTYTVHLIDLTGLTVIATLDDANPPGPNREMRSVGNVVWSSDGRRVVTVGSDHTARVWDGFTGKSVSTLLGHRDWIVRVAFSLDARQVLTASEDDTAKVWDAATGKTVATLSGHTAGLFDAVFDPTGRRALTCSEDRTARLWDARTGKLLRVWPDHEGNVCRVEFLGDGKQVRTQTARGIVRIWSAQSGALLSTTKPERNVSYRFGNCFLRDNGESTEMWVGPAVEVPPPTNDGRQRMILGEPVITDDSPNAALVQPRSVFHGHKGHVTTVAFSADGNTLASAGNDQAVILWDMKQWDRVTGRGRVVLRHDVEVRSMALTADGRTVAAGCEDGSVRLWDTGGATKRRMLKSHRGAVACLVFSPDGTAVASAGLDKVVKVCEVAGGKELFAVVAALAEASAVAFSPDGKLLAVGGSNGANTPGEIVLCDAVTGKELRRLQGHTSEVKAVTFTPDGKSLVSGGWDGTVRLWDTRMWKERARLTGHAKWVEAVAVSADSKLLASGDWEGTIRLWDAASGKERAVFKGHDSGANCLAFTPDGKSLASGVDGVMLWDVAEILKRRGGDLGR
jgi:WD40 repeat protein